MVFSHEIINGIEKVMVTDVDEWTYGLRWLFLGLLLCNGTGRGLCYGFGCSLGINIGHRLRLPFVGLIDGPVGQGTLARVNAW